MTAEVDVGAPATSDALERHQVVAGPYRDALLALLGAHAAPVWGFGQRAAYEALVMEGPSLDHWVRTGNLWAEQERNLWEWEQLVGALTDGPADAVVSGAVGELATRVSTELRSWVDLPLLAGYLDGLGEQLVRTLGDSSYAPLRRYARVMVMYKRGQAADGINALAEVRGLRQLDPAEVDERASVWDGLLAAFASAIADAEADAGWVSHGIATPFDAEAAVSAVRSRLQEHVEEAP